MTSFFIFALALVAAFTAAMTVLTQLAFRSERRYADARAARLRARAASSAATPAQAISLADRRRTVRTDIEVERRAA